MKHAVLMSRVSSDEQAKGYSLDIQVEKLSEHCRKENISIVNIFKEDHSAKNFNRPEFKKLLHYLKTNEGKVDLLMVTSWDRFSRNLTESFAMIERLKNLGVEVQAIEQPLDLSVPENLMILSVYLALPDIDNKRRSIKITEGMRAAKIAGRWTSKAPYGYKIGRDDRNKPILLPSEQEAKTVRKIFFLLAKGKSQGEVKTILEKGGLFFKKTTFSQLVRNRVYIGNICMQSESGGGYYIKGQHEAIAEESVFQKAQAAMESRLQQKNFTKVKSFQPELHLRGLLLCDICGKHLTGSASRGRNGAKHHYYHCNNCSEVRVKASATHEHIEAMLSEFKVNTQAVKHYEKMVGKLLQGESKKQRPETKIKEELTQYQKRLSNMEDDFADRFIDLETFTKSKKRYETETGKLQGELESATGKQTGVQKLLKKGIHVLQQLPEFYQKGSIEVKRELLGSIFTEKLWISEKKCRTTKINEAILLISATDKGFIGQKKGQLFKNLELSVKVEPTELNH